MIFRKMKPVDYVEEGLAILLLLAVGWLVARAWHYGAEGYGTLRAEHFIVPQGQNSFQLNSSGPASPTDEPSPNLYFWTGDNAVSTTWRTLSGWLGLTAPGLTAEVPAVNAPTEYYPSATLSTVPTLANSANYTVNL